MKYWFKAKRYGWGWYPSSWEGWFIIGLWVIANIYGLLHVDTVANSANDALIHISPLFLFSTCLLFAICYATGEKPRWRWGEDASRTPNE